MKERWIARRLFPNEERQRREKKISGLMMGEWRIIPRVPRDVGGGGATLS